MVRCCAGKGAEQGRHGTPVQYYLRRRLPNGSNASANGVDGFGATVPQDLFHCQAKQRLPHALRLRPLRRQRLHGRPDRRGSRRISGDRQPHLGGGSASTGSRPWKPAEPVPATSASIPARSFTSISKKLGRFEQTGHRITGDRKGQSNSRGVGWEYLHLAIDDRSRVAYSEILPDEKRGSCLRFSVQCVALLSGTWRQGFNAS